MPVLLKENFNRWYSLRSYYLAITISDIPFQVSIRRCLKSFHDKQIFAGDFLLHLRVHRVLLHIPTDGAVPLRNVLDCLPADFLRRSIGRSRRWSGDERAERSFPRAGHVGAVSSVFWLFRFVRRDSDLLAVDHVLELHPLWVRGDGPGNLRIRPREAQMLPDLLSLQIADHNAGGTRHDELGHSVGHHRADHHFHHFENRGFPVLAMEVEEAALGGCK